MFNHEIDRLISIIDSGDGLIDENKDEIKNKRRSSVESTSIGRL